MPSSRNSDASAVMRLRHAVGGRCDSQGIAGHQRESTRRIVWRTPARPESGGSRRYHCPHAPPAVGFPAMIRRHAAGFRALLMAADALARGRPARRPVSVALRRRLGDLVAPDRADPRGACSSSTRRLGRRPDDERPLPAAGALVDPRARRVDVLRATIVLALVTLSVLFVFQLPDVSRLFLLVLFPAQAVATVASRVVLRLAHGAASGDRARTCDSSWSSVPDRAARRSPPSSRTIASSACASIGFLDDSPDLRAAESAGPYLGTLDSPRGRPPLTGRRRGRDLPAVLAVGPDRRDRPPVRGGGQDRPDPDGRPRSRDHGRARRGARRDARLLARVRARIARSPWPSSASLDVVVAAVGLVLLSPCSWSIAVAIALDDGAPDPLPPGAGRAPRSAVPGRQVPLDDARTPRRARPTLAQRQRDQRAAPSR